MLCTILGSVGALTIAYVVCGLLKPVFTYFILKYFFSKRKNLKKAGEWAIVTGATDGIGLAFAKLLAEEGLNIFLISRTKGKLEEVAKSISSDYKVNVKIFVADFSKTDFYEKLEGEISGLSSISCLVNNVGVSYKYPDRLWDSKHLTQSDLTNLIMCNCNSMACMSRIVLPKMLAHPQPPKGVKRFIVNCGSLSGVFPTPYLSVYSASKAFALRLTQSLKYELTDTCVDVQLFTPSFVATNMTGIRRFSTAVPSPDTFADSALSMLGVETVGSGYFHHAFMLTMYMFLPNCMLVPGVASRMLKLRNKAISREKAN